MFAGGGDPPGGAVALGGAGCRPGAGRGRLHLGVGVFGQLTGGGFDDPASESSRAAERITRELGPQGADLVVLWSSDTSTVDQPAFRDPVAATVAGLRARPEITSVTTWYDTAAPVLLSTDRRATYALVQLRAANKDDKAAAYEELRPALTAPGRAAASRSWRTCCSSVREASTANSAASAAFWPPSQPGTSSAHRPRRPRRRARPARRARG